ncbi:hypothetical protein LCGC14_0734140 [marine sediment metagenome]|uniref:Uncharacterized protein n=1 Tax=marine sediment metagenome TaxID=412755 RepID=A0A0F9QTM9_9ZZZZ
MKIAEKGISYQFVRSETDLKAGVAVIQRYKDGVKSGDPVTYCALPRVPQFPAGLSTHDGCRFPSGDSITLHPTKENWRGHKDSAHVCVWGNGPLEEEESDG